MTRLVEFDEIKKLLNKEVTFKCAGKERYGKITKINEDSETFHYEYADPDLSAGAGGTAHRINVVKIEGNTVFFD